MPGTDIPDDLLGKLIAIGKSDEFSDLPSLLAPTHQRRYAYVMRLRPDPWREVAEGLTTEDLVGLIKCLTIAERALDGWRAGSVSPVIWLFGELRIRDSKAAEVIAHWVSDNTTNPYLPFGTMNRGMSAERARQRRESEENRRALAKKRISQKATLSLFSAINSGDTKGVKALIAKGADVLPTDKDGVSILEHAQAKGHQGILDLLDEAAHSRK